MSRRCGSACTPRLRSCRFIATAEAIGAAIAAPYYGGGYYPYYGYGDDYGYAALPYGYPAYSYGYASRPGFYRGCYPHCGWGG